MVLFVYKRDGRKEPSESSLHPLCIDNPTDHRPLVAFDKVRKIAALDQLPIERLLMIILCLSDHRTSKSDPLGRVGTMLTPLFVDQQAVIWLGLFVSVPIEIRSIEY